MPDNPFSAIAQAFYTPKLNAVGVDSQGNYVDADGKPTSLYTQPGWFERAFNPEAQQIQSMNVQGSAQGLEAQKQAAIQRGLIGSQVDNMPAGSNPFGSSFSAVPTDGTDGPINTAPMARNAWISSIANPALQPTNLKPQVEAGGMLGTGLIASTGANNAIAGYATSDYGKQLAQGQQVNAPIDVASEHQTALNRLAQATKVDPKQIAVADQQLTGELGRMATTQELLNRVQQNSIAEQKVNTAKIGTEQAVANQDYADRGIIAGTQGNQNLWANIASQWNPDTRATTAYQDTVLPNGGGVRTSGGMLSPTYRPPAAAMMQSMQNGSFMGGRGGQVTAPAGITQLVRPTPSNVVRPTMGVGYEDSDSGGASGSPTTYIQPSQSVPISASTTSATRMTTGQRLLQRVVPPTQQVGSPMGARPAAAVQQQAVQQANQVRIQQLTQMLQNPHNGRGVQYSPQALQQMANELDTLLGEK